MKKLLLAITLLLSSALLSRAQVDLEKEFFLELILKF